MMVQKRELKSGEGIILKEFFTPTEKEIYRFAEIKYEYSDTGDLPEGVDTISYDGLTLFNGFKLEVEYKLEVVCGFLANGRKVKRCYFSQGSYRPFMRTHLDRAVRILDDNHREVKRSILLEIEV